MGIERRTAVLNVRVRPLVKTVAKMRAEQEGRSLPNYLEQLVLRDAGEHGIRVRAATKKSRGGPQWVQQNAAGKKA